MSDDIGTVSLIVAFLALIIALAGVVYPSMENQVDYHRKWSWADESAFSKVVPIPLGKPSKYANNPILSPRVGKWDSQQLSILSVVRYGNYYYLMYAGRSAAVNYQGGIARASFANFPYTWTRFDNPIIPIEAGEWDDVYIIESKTVVDFDDNLFKTWYVGANGASGQGGRGLGLTTCPLTSDPTNPANWTKYAGNPVFDPVDFYAINGILKLGNLYYMIWQYDGVHNFRCASSDDGINWTDRGKVGISQGGTGWEQNNVGYATLFWNLGLTYCFYSGQDSAVKWRVGMAVAGNDLLSYNKFFGNPVIDLGVGGSWDDNRVFKPALIMVDGVFYIFYTGNNGTTNKIGVSTIP